jgi:hypothetical protein
LHEQLELGALVALEGGIGGSGATVGAAVGASVMLHTTIILDGLGKHELL